MTCIAAIAHEGKVFMGADRMTSAGNLKFGKTEPKVSIINSEMIVGICGYVRFGNIFNYHLSLKPYRKFHDEPGKEMDYLITHVAEEMRKKSAELSADRVDSSRQGSDSGVMIGLNGKIFSLGSDYSVCGHGEYFADGSGVGVALGSLYSTGGKEPEERIRTAILAAAHHTAYVDDTIDILSV